MLFLISSTIIPVYAANKGGFSGYTNTKENSFYIYSVYQETTLKTGKEINVILKELARQEGASNTTYNSNIKAIKQSKQAHSNSIVTKNIAMDGEPEVLDCFDNSDGTIYCYTTALETYMNTDSSYMFYQCDVMNNISGLSNLKTDKVANMSWMFFQFRCKFV